MGPKLGNGSGRRSILEEKGCPAQGKSRAACRMRSGSGGFLARRLPRRRLLGGRFFQSHRIGGRRLPGGWFWCRCLGFRHSRFRCRLLDGRHLCGGRLHSGFGFGGRFRRRSPDSLGDRRLGRGFRCRFFCFCRHVVSPREMKRDYTIHASPNQSGRFNLDHNQRQSQSNK